ncbi:HupE/UreJ family protein [Marinobacterium sediminicola]|uniref:HupE / UreJ protein n=1 Tax=Marinobacterium sediminicola TaxID=518898 RepID=A0ABY1S2D3_9GAMM|nr:HupE / UreJ protein [Marinobacterium sediminicola]
MLPKKCHVMLAWLLCLSGLLSTPVMAHGVDGADAAFMQQSDSGALSVWIYLGAKHMVTGYDHLLFLLGVIFFLYRLTDVALYVSLFALGHSLTLLAGVLGDIRINPFLIDAIIGLSIVYKALDNLGAFQRWFGVRPDTRLAVLVFGLCHGFGLATKLQDFSLPEDGLVSKILAFNVGVELGQLCALGLMLALLNIWRGRGFSSRQAITGNALLMIFGFLLTGYQLSGYMLLP